MSKPGQRAARATDKAKHADGAGKGAGRSRSGKPLAELLGEQRVAGLHIDLRSMALVSNIHRASGIIRERARANGMRTLREDGLRKAGAGLTTLEEVVRMTAADVSD